MEAINGKHIMEVCAYTTNWDIFKLYEDLYREWQFLYFFFCFFFRDRMFLWLSNGQTQKGKDKPEDFRKLNLMPPGSLTLIHKTLLCLEPCP